MKVFKNFVAGAWVEPSTGKYFDNRNPADLNDVIGKFPLSNSIDVDRAVASAKRGFELWKATPAPQRGDILRKAGDLLVARKEEIADAMTREMG
jgi:aldehyde dehydrogenase (NAD+)